MNGGKGTCNYFQNACANVKVAFPDNFAVEPYPVSGWFGTTN